MTLPAGTSLGPCCRRASSGSWRQLTDFGQRATLIARRVSWSSDGRSIYAAVAEGDSDVVLLGGLR
jgi:hypothetical protein